MTKPLPVFYSPLYTAAAEDFDTTRKATWIASSLVADPLTGVGLVCPPSLTRAQLATVHAPEYIEAVRTGHPRAVAESSGLGWCAKVWPAVRASSGGAVAAAKSAVASGRSAGSLSSGLHHARRAFGAGFCTFNGLALAAAAVLSQAPRRRVLILDLDAHGGGGTYSLVREWASVVQLDISVCPLDLYEPAGASTLDVVDEAGAYLPTLARRLSDLTTTDFDLVLYNAGVDPYEGCDVGGLTGVTAAVLAARDQMVFDWARRRQTPVAFVLAGGYVGAGLSQATLVGLHRQTIAAARG